MTRFKQGPFGGIFDGLDYESPLFAPVVIVCALLIFIWIGLVWVLLRRKQPKKLDRMGGFEVKLTGMPPGSDEGEKERD